MGKETSPVPVTTGGNERSSGQVFSNNETSLCTSEDQIYLILIIQLYLKEILDIFVSTFQLYVEYEVD